MGGLLQPRRSMGTKTSLIATILVFASITHAFLPTPELSGSLRSITRNPRLFYVSSSTSTSFATTRCYISSATGTCKRKKRNLVDDEFESQLDGEEEIVEQVHCHEYPCNPRVYSWGMGYECLWLDSRQSLPPAWKSICSKIKCCFFLLKILLF